MSRQKTTGAESWSEGFESEDYADLVVCYEGQKLVALYRDFDVIPVENLQGDMEDREVVEVEILPGTTVTDRIFEIDKDSGKSTDVIIDEKPVMPGEIRSFWVSSAVLKKHFKEYAPNPGEEFAVFNGGKKDSKRGTREYTNWKMAMPRGKASRQATLERS